MWRVWWMAALCGLAACGRSSSDPPPFGFTLGSADVQLALERQFAATPDAGRLRDAHRVLTSAPHPAASIRDRELADWVAQRFGEAGMEEIRITTHDVLVPRPVAIEVSMAEPEPWAATLREDPITGDADTQIDPALAGLPHHAYSASGDVTAPLVYAGDGDPAAFEWLAAQGVDVRGAIVLVRCSTTYRYRGFKAFTAEQHGAAGVLMFPDAEPDRDAPSAASAGYGPSGSRIERGSILYDFLVPGDPLTPGWPSVRGARRTPRGSAVSLPKIPSAPISARDARVLLHALGGPAAPGWWQPGSTATYHVGAGPAQVRLRVEMEEQIRPVWTVTGLFRGTQFPDEIVIAGNHRDAWVFGGVDPSSGTAALVELARSLGAVFRNGARPRRSILFASWDAEELGLTSSTEWAEENAAWLRDRAIAYLNVDSAVAGSRLSMNASPSLSRVLGDVAGIVRDPLTGIPLAAVARERAAGERGVAGSGGNANVAGDRLGGGSDYVVFLDHLGIPSANLGFEGAYGVYHSLYDTHGYMARVVDPTFRWHRALVQLWGLAALRLANADAIPIDPEASAARITAYLAELRPQITSTPDRAADRAMSDAATDLQHAAAEFTRKRSSALASGDLRALAALNRDALRFERAFIDDRGLTGRPWYRHLVYAPKFTYEPLVLPGVAEALARGDGTFGAEAGRLAAAIRRAAAVLRADEPLSPHP